MDDYAESGKRSRSGVRRGGDRFQDVFVLGAALELLRPSTPYTELGVELDGAGNVDDVVLRNSDEPGGRYGQVKWATNSADPITEDFLFATKGKGTSILQKLYTSWRKLGAGNATQLRFISNRPLDSTHPLLGHIDGDTDRLTPHARISGPSSEAGRAVTRWADHLDTDKVSLLEMFDHLVFHAGRQKSAELERVQSLMLAAGLDDSRDALTRALAGVQDWVIAGIRTRTAEQVRRWTEERGLIRADPSIILSVQSIDHDPQASDADFTVNWLHHYAEDSARTRVVPKSPTAWAEMATDLAATVAAIEDGGVRSVVVRGAMRQATAFKVGSALPQTRNFELAIKQRQQTWSTSDDKRTVAIRTRAHSVQAGTDLAVALGISVDPTEEVARYIADESIAVADLLVISPEAGENDDVVASGGHCVALAERVRNEIRSTISRYPQSAQIHLYLAGPLGFALLLGHRWNRMSPTVVYEHRGRSLGYQPAFTVDG